MIDPIAQQAVNDVFALFEQHGRADYIGERISQWEHAYPCCAFRFLDMHTLPQSSLPMVR
jgi:predicted HD phosphohydrolase